MLLGLSLCVPNTCCQCTKLIHFLTCTGIPCRDSHCENGLVRCCLYTSRRLQQTAVSCKQSNCNNIEEKSWKSHVWGFIQRRQTTGLSVLSCRFARKLICGLSFNCHGLHLESLHCHHLEELDDWCHFWYFQNGTGLSCCSPDSWCRRFNVVNASLKSERSLTSPVFFHNYWERSTNSFCIESTLLASYDMKNLSARSRPSGYRLLQFDHVRVEIHEIQDLSRIDREFLFKCLLMHLFLIFWAIW